MTRTYGRFRQDGGAWLITELEPHVTIRLKHLFPRIPKTAAPPFRFPNDPTHAADLDWFMQRYPLAANDGDLAALRGGRLAFETNQAEMERILLPDYQAPAYAGLRPRCEVRAYQAQAVDLLARSKGLALCDEVGLGKTFATAAACLMDGALPAVVVCQAHLQSQWVRVISAFTTLRVHTIKGTRPYELPPADVYVFRYTQLAGWSDMFEPLGAKLVAFDEVQELRTGQASQKGQAARRLCNHAEYRLGLSATPIYNYGAEVWEVMQFLRPELLGSREEFMREWTTDWKHITDPKALGTYLRENYALLRRTKADVGQEMPAVNKIIDTVDYDEKTVQSIEDLARALAVKATTASFVERGQAARDLDIMVRKHTGIAKAAHVADFVRLVVEAGDPVVLFGWHRDVYDIWLERLADLNPAMYTGSESASAKARGAEAFLAGETNILIMSLRSGAGLDGLQVRCSTAIFGELDWSPGVHHQCIGRLDREGQTQPVTAIFLVTEEGSDPPMMEVLGLKASESTQIVDPLLAPGAAHSDASHLQKLVQRYLGKRERAALKAAGQLELVT